MLRTEAAPTSDGFDGAWQRMWRNAAVVVGGRAAFGLVNLAAAALAVRAVGIEAFGVLILLQAYVRLIAGVVRFQSWAAITRFGAETIAGGRTDDFGRLLGFTLRLDVLSMVVAIAIGMAAAAPVGEWFDWPSEARAFAPWFALTIPFITTATPTGLLRLFDRFGLLVWQHASNAVIRLVGSTVVYISGGGLAELIIVWGAAYVLSGLYTMVQAASELRQRELAPRLRASWSELTAGFPRIWRFVLVLKTTVLLDTLLKQGAVLVVGGMLGVTAAGLFGLVQQVTGSLKRLSLLLGPIVFSEFAWLEARGDRRSMARLLARTMVLSGVALGLVALLFLFAGEALLTLLFGPEAAPAAPLLAIVGGAAALAGMAFAVDPVMLTIRKEKALLRSSVMAAIIFGGALYGGILSFGLIGVGVAVLLRQVLTFVYRLAVLYRALVLRPRASRLG